ncbi:hypothetical protein Ade02nite_19300 [Paractinoplanes deccanensis]|uniref:Uncharacterized protein n=1 Tax=Paractinoplanes deccanensis TaxID=113561 RepID=A0ABQ3XZY4_9ACTN|nr:hypothetical protein [Actinoplanes deccanensis]GID73289.1 hypothetical protein Ade02nite_19300 [Actinoplanes deccanensis]
MTSPITGHMVVMQYYDRSGLLGAFGPYPTWDAAKDAIGWIRELPMQDALFEVVPLFGAPGLDEATQ